MERQKLAISPGLPGDGLFNVLTNAVPGFVWLTDDEGKVEFVNEGWCAFTGLSCEQSHGDGWLQAIHEEDIAELGRAWRNVRAEQLDRYEVTTRCRRHDGAYRWHKVSVRRVPEVDRGHWIGCSVDIHEQVQSQEKDAFQLRILERVAAGAELDDILVLLCEYAEAQLPDAHCSLLLVDAKKGIFTRGVAPSLPREMVSSIEGIAYGPGIGSCGTAAFEKRDIIVSDIATDLLWQNLHDLALPYGMRACWSRPVLSTDGEVLATFAFYFPEIRSPTPDEMSRMDGIAHIASMSIERGNILEALRESEEHYRHTVELNPQFPWTADAQGRILTVSSKWAAETGLPHEETLNSGWLSVLHPDDVQPTLEHWDKRLVTGEPVDIQYRIRLKDGTYRWMRARAAARRDRAGNIVRWYGTLEDIHEHYLATDRLRQAAFEDELTKLPNRRRFESKLRSVLKEAVARRESVGLIILDLDDFKQINDRFGHAAGDAVLRLFAHHMHKQARPNEFVARLGGDEFAIIVPDVEGEEFIVRRAGDLTTAIDKQLKRSTKARNSHASAGCAISAGGDSAEELLKKADLALYDSKSAQRGAVRLFTPAIRAEHVSRAEQLELARKALQSGWIVPHYQPKVSLANGSIMGMEALVRVAHPERGILPPASIMSALDHPRIGGPLGARVLTHVMADIKKWREQLLEPGHVSVNMSGQHLIQKDFPEWLLKSLRQAGVAPSMLKLEITERVLLDEIAPSVASALGQLREAGIGISLDDFGTGYASLTHLRRFPVNEIKIDRSFIQGLAIDSSNAAIVKAMINLGRNLGMDVVAEGVETATQALLLRTWGCETAQGFLYCRPLPADKIPDLINALQMQDAPFVAPRPGFALESRHAFEGAFQRTGSD